MTPFESPHAGSVCTSCRLKSGHCYRKTLSFTSNTTVPNVFILIGHVSKQPQLTCMFLFICSSAKKKKNTFLILYLKLLPNYLQSIYKATCWKQSAPPTKKKDQRIKHSATHFLTFTMAMRIFPKIIKKKCPKSKLSYACDFL